MHFISSRRSSRRALAAAALLTGSLAAVSAHAQPAPRDKAPRLPELSLEAAATSDVPQDKVTLTLAHEVQGSDQARITQQLNTALEKVLAQAKTATKVTAHSGNYRVWPNTDRDGKITGWRGRAEVILESRDFAAASRLAGDLSAQMPVSNISFSLSREAREAEEKRLLDEAAKAFATRAGHAAQAFGFGGYTIRSLDLGGSGTVFSQPHPVAMAAPAFAAKREDAVPLEGGKATVTITVRGTVALQPR